MTETVMLTIEYCMLSICNDTQHIVFVFMELDFMVIRI